MLLYLHYISEMNNQSSGSIRTIRPTSEVGEHGGTLTSLPWLAGWTRWAQRRGRTRGPKTPPRLSWWSSDRGASPWPTTPQTALTPRQAKAKKMHIIQGHTKAEVGGNKISSECTLLLFDPTYGHEPSWAPTDAGMMPCWRCSPGSTRWCEWPDTGARLQSQTATQFKYSMRNYT